MNQLHGLRILSPFQWYLGGFLVRDGLEPSRVAALVIASAAAVVVGVVTLERRDIAA